MEFELWVGFQKKCASWPKHKEAGERLEICQDRRDRRSCKIFPSCVKLWGNNANLLGNYRVTYALNE